jgi:SPP1 family predicted phage head-tail adaptor
MRAGKLDRKIDIERAETTLDAHGVPQEVWVNVATMRAQLVQTSTEEFIRAYGASSESVVIFRTRFLAGVTVADRVLYDGRAYDIKETREIGRRHGLELRCIAHGGD